MLAHYSVSRWQGFFFIVLNCQKYIKIFEAGNISVKLETLLAYEIKKSRNHT